MGKRDRESADLGAMVHRMLRALVRRAAQGDTEALEELVKLQAAASTQVAAAGVQLVRFGYSYAELADVLGISRQAARQRFTDTEERTA